MRHLMMIVLMLIALPTIAQVSTAYNPDTGIITDARWKTGVPLGGIGCGAVEVLTDGGLGNATITHNWDRPTSHLKGGFFAVRAQAQGAEPIARILRAKQKSEYIGVESIASSQYLGMYPRAEISFSDAILPVQVSLHAWSPLIPNNTADSALPVAVFDFTLTNPSTQTVNASLLASWENLIGFGGRKDENYDETSGCRQFKSIIKDANSKLSGLRYTWVGPSFPDRRQNTIGEMYLGAVIDDTMKISACPYFDPQADALSFWDTFTQSGSLSNASRTMPLVNPTVRPAGAVSASCSLAPGESRKVRFILAWHMPVFRMEHIVRSFTDEFIEQANAGRAAIDGNMASRWSTGRGMQPNDQFILTLPAVQTVNEIVLDSTPSAGDWPRGLRVEVADEAGNWVQVAELSLIEAGNQQQQGKLTLQLEPVQAKQIRITNLGPVDSLFWSIHEIQLTGPDGVIDLSRARISDRLVKSEVQTVISNPGHYYLNKMSRVSDTVRYVASEADRLLAETCAWQDPVLASNLPWWLKQKLINCAYTMYSATVLTKDGRFAVMESPIDMGGALGTMDQRMAAHAFYTQMFPELDRSDLSMFADCQQPDGRITHFNGNIHEVVGDPRVGYGITDWPDLSAAWILQVVKLYRWTGDRAFLNEMWPYIQKAAAWLKSADADGDKIPEGGSTYDYEQLPPGAFIYSASCTLGAYAAAREAAQVVGNLTKVIEYNQDFNDLQKAVMNRLWNGERFIKWRSAVTTYENPNSFVASLAGDWLAHITGLPNTLDPSILNRETEQLIARHLKPFFPVPPMEVTENGEVATGACYVLQHEPYLGCEAIYQGYVDDGLEVLRRVWHCAWVQNESPWDQSLAYSAPDGGQGGLRSYMTCPTSWHVLNALSGVTLDVPNLTLYVSPRLTSDMKELHIPLYLARFWAQLDFVPAKKELKLTITKVFGDPVIFTRIARDGNRKPKTLPEGFIAEVGAVLDLSKYISELVPYKTSKQVDWMVKVKQADRIGLPADDWTITAGTPLAPPEKQESTQLACDGIVNTRWNTRRAMRPGDWMQVDLGATQRIIGVRLDISKFRTDYPRGYAVSTSKDGVTWQTVAEGDAQTSKDSMRKGIWRVSFPATDARYVRVEQLGTEDFWWWSVGEIYIIPEGWRDPVPTGLLNVQKKRMMQK